MQCSHDWSGLVLGERISYLFFCDLWLRTVLDETLRCTLNAIYNFANIFWRAG